MENKTPKVIHEHTTRIHISKDLTIALPDGRELIVNKFYNDDDIGGCDGDYEFYDDENTKLFHSLDEDTQDAVVDAINQYKI